MNAEQFFHVCRSAATIADVRELTVFGSAAVVPWIARERPGAPFWPSIEVDLDPGGDELATLVDGAIGELSTFHETFGVHVHGVTLAAFTALPDWPARAAVFTEPRTGARIRTPHPLDLAISKLTRGLDGDWRFASYCREHFGLSIDDIRAGLRAIAEGRPEKKAACEEALAQLNSRL